MFALPGIVALVIFILARPLDFVEALRGVPFLYIFFGLAVFGLIIDARLGHIKLRATPQLGLVLGCIALALLSAAVMAPHVLADEIVALAIVLALFVVVGQGLSSFKALELVAGAILLCTLWICAVCVHQGLQPLTCVAIDQKDDLSAMGRPDGRRCDNVEVCYVDPPEPQAIYRCEHAGILGITSVGDGRVRYVGVLHDPNEAALSVSLALPIAVAFYHRRRTRTRRLLVLATGVLAAATVILSKSRGGLLVFAAALGVYFLKRYGWRGALAGALAALPVMLLGGRAGDRAESSTNERLEIWHEGIEMVRAYPALGVGHSQFTEHHPLTAHSSVLLAAAENGILGAVLWTAVMYLSLKIPYRVLREIDSPKAEVARTWALALLASLAGLWVGALFLTFNYHYVLWIYVGLSAALCSAVRAHHPGFRVRFGLGDLVLVTAVSLGLLGGIFVASRVMLG